MTGRHKFVVAGRLMAWTLRRLQCAAVVMPGRTIYMLPEHFWHVVVRRHELVHIMQMDRDGWKFWPRCVWYVLRYGYWNSPYEIEARKLSEY